ncbi:MAG: hypothetical protein RSB87_06265 [Clostridia bacterium]
MSYSEYEDLKEIAKEKGPYRVFTLDVKNSRKLGYDADKIMMYLEVVYKILEDRNVIHKIKENTKMILTKEPARICGDLFAFTIKNNKISVDEVYKILKEEKEKNGVESFFHVYSCVYETDDFVKGDKLYYRMYAISSSDHDAKKEGIII